MLFNLLPLLGKLETWFYMVRSLFVNRDEKIWVFGAWLGKKYRDNSMEFFEWVSANKPEIKAYWFTTDNTICEHLKSRGLKVINSEDQKEEAKVILKKCKYAVVSIGLIDITNNTKLLYGVTIINLWHGMPLKGGEKYAKNECWSDKTKTKVKKLFGLSIRQISVAASDYMLQYTKQTFQHNRFGFEMPVIGYPNHDALLRERRCELTDRIERKYHHSLKVLYMPTFRQSRDFGIPFRPFEGFGFDIQYFTEILERNNIVFLNKGHFWDKRLTDKRLSERIVDVEDTPIFNNMDLLRSVDVLVTDYSSIYYDFLFTGKPIIKAPFDYDDYCMDRGFVVDYDSLPGLRVNNWKELCTALDNHTYYGFTPNQIKKYFKYCDGKSSERLFHYIQATSTKEV